jgi:hypothetical protein
MRASVLAEQIVKQGLLGGKTRYQVTVQLHLEDDEAVIIEAYTPYSVLIREHVELGDDELMRVLKHNPSFAAGYTQPVTVAFESIQQAGKFEDGMLSAFAQYKVQVDAARVRAARLGAVREIEL